MLDLKNVPHGTFKEYINLLEQWNNKINLVRYKNQEELWQRHINDSIQLGKYIKPTNNILDIGSGAGFPGLILSYLGIKETHLVEINQKKINFLELAGKLSKNKIFIHQKRIETISNIEVDIITARGFSEIIKLLDSTKTLRNKNTKYILLKGEKTDIEIKKALEKYQFNYILEQSETCKSGKIVILDQVINE